MKSPLHGTCINSVLLADNFTKKKIFPGNEIAIPTTLHNLLRLRMPTNAS